MKGRGYAGWLVRNAQRMEQVRTTTNTLVALAQNSWDWFIRHAQQHDQVDSAFQQSILNGAVGFIKSTHVVMTYPMMLGLGLLPLGWAVGIVLQRLVPVPGAFVVLLIANAFKAYILGILYLWFPWWVKILILLTVAGLMAWSIRSVVRRSNTQPS